MAETSTRRDSPHRDFYQDRRREILTQTAVFKVLAVRSTNTAVNDKLVLQVQCRVILRYQFIYISYTTKLPSLHVH